MPSHKPQRWDAKSIKALLSTSHSARLRALRWLWSQQTKVEQKSRITTEHNSVGFTGIDAPTLSAIAAYSERHNWEPLLPGMDTVLQNMLPKYWRQMLVPIATKNAGIVAKSSKSSITLGAASHG